MQATTAKPLQGQAARKAKQAAAKAMAASQASTSQPTAPITPVAVTTAPAPLPKGKPHYQRHVGVQPTSVITPLFGTNPCRGKLNVGRFAPLFASFGKGGITFADFLKHAGKKYALLDLQWALAHGWVTVSTPAAAATPMAQQQAA